MSSDNLNLLWLTPVDFNYTNFATSLDYLNQSKEQLLSGSADSSSVVKPVQPCSLSTPTAPPVSSNKKPEPNCKFTKVTISHKDKSVTINPAIVELIEVVCGYDKNLKAIKFKIEDLAGPCPKHNNKTFDVLSAKQNSNSELTFKAVSIPFNKIFDTGVIFPWNAKKSYNNININTCGYSLSKQLIVYPDVSVKIDIPLNFASSKDSTQNVTRSEKNVHVYTKESDEIKVNAEYVEDGVTWTINPDIESKYKKVKDFVVLADNAFGALQKAFDETIKISFTYPSGKLHFDFAFKEYEGKFRVGSEWHVQALLDPLIGAKVTIQLDELFLQASTGPIGKFYSELKKVLKTAGASIKLELIISGQIGVDLGLQKLIGDIAETKTGGGISGKIEADLKASAGLKIKFIICVEANVEAGVKTGVKGSAGIYNTNGSLNLDLGAEFLGVTFYFIAKWNGGPIDKEDPKASPDLIGASDENRVTVRSGKWTKTIPIT